MPRIVYIVLHVRQAVTGGLNFGEAQAKEGQCCRSNPLFESHFRSSCVIFTGLQGYSHLPVRICDTTKRSVTNPRRIEFPAIPVAESFGGTEDRRSMFLRGSSLHQGDANLTSV